MNKIVLIAASTAASIAFVGCGSSDSDTESNTETTATEQTTTTEPTTTQETTTTAEAEKPTQVKVVVVNGAPQGGIVRRTVDKNDRVVLVVTSDAADEIHLHGYDKSRDVAAGATIRLPFEATIPGRFEAELEGRGVQIAEITVEP